jgi:NADH-quinone oxidoreductase subunit L
MPTALLMLASTWIALSWNPFSIDNRLLHMLLSGRSSIEAAILSIGVLAITFPAAYFIYRRKKEIKPFTFLTNALYLDTVYNWIITKPTLAVSAMASTIDSKWIDGALHYATYINVTFAHLITWFDATIVDGIVHSFAATARGIGSLARSFQGGKIQLYIFWAALGLIIFIIWILFQ